MQTKAELESWMINMLPRDFRYLDQSSAAYRHDIQQLEALLRPMWGVIPAYFSGNRDPQVVRYLSMLQQRIDTNDLPPITTHNRQIAVELGVVAYALGVYQADFLSLFTAAGQDNLVAWLNQVNQIEFPAGNWYFFLTLVNAALKKNHLLYSKARLRTALKTINGFYVGNGWYTDGNNHQMDYYVSFAFHFYGMLYARMFDDDNAQNFRRRALVFADQFQYWFDERGRSLPFGRSLTYRFAHVSFWSQMIVSGLYQESHLSLGQIKGILMRNFQFWQRQPIITPHGHQLSVGYGYAQQLMSEDYNAQGSPMWAFKSFVLFELPDTNAFWKADVEALDKQAQISQPESGFLISTSPDQSTVLSVTQYAGNPQLYRGTEKYSKLAYSTYFGFNVSRGQQGLDSFAIDSTLAFSLPKREQYQTRRQIDAGKVMDTYAVSRWHVYDDVEVTTYLVPITAEAHVRIHEMHVKHTVDVAEGSFALQRWNRKYDDAQVEMHASHLTSSAGSVGIIDLLNQRVALVTPQGPNTNVYDADKNAVATLKSTIGPGEHVFASLVYGSPQSDYQVPSVSLVQTPTEFDLTIDGKIMAITRAHNWLSEFV